MMKTDVRVLIADDHGIVRMGMRQIIAQLLPKAQFTEAGDYKTFNALVSQHTYDLAVIDVHMPNGTLAQALDLKKQKQPNLKILVFSAQDEQLYGLRYLQMGADGFLNKLSSPEKIHTAVRAMLEKGRYISEEIRDIVVTRSLEPQPEPTGLAQLSDRELEIAGKLAEGISLKELSNQFHLHPSTISTYKVRIFKKLQIQSVVELAALLDLYN